MRNVPAVIFVSVLLGGCGTMTEYDTNQTVNANSDCLVGEGALGESAACGRESGIRFGEKSEEVDLSGTGKSDKTPL